MKRHQVVRVLVFAISLLLISAPLSAQRAPQYIAISFDGSKSLQVWQETLDFAKEHKIYFTFFVSGVYFLADENRGYYHPPRRAVGRSDIGFGGSVDEIAARIAFVRRAFREGHEIASHANGHWNGASWSYDEWLSELQQFNDILLNVHEINGLENTNQREWRRIVQSINGFRAPLLAVNSNMFQALADLGYKYDASRVAVRNYWPQRLEPGLWNFPLVSLPIGRGTVLSMDYNFYALHNRYGGNPRSSMERAYFNYFAHNYENGRAPMHIGHHFSRWKQGAYWAALSKFAAERCNQPEVICGTYYGLQRLMPRIQPQ